ncbi:MAG: hypothetical protein HYV97_10175 [Bdellovibrio sp.]|nr:hypothetical protein [Bdellovibrio sp.]
MQMCYRFLRALLPPLVFWAPVILLAAEIDPVRIAFIDTEFCLEHLIVPQGLQKKIGLNSHLPSSSLCKTQKWGMKVPPERWAHGHHVLKTFLQELSNHPPSDFVIEIHAYNIFGPEGTYTLKDWEEMFKVLMKNPPDFIIMASTYYGPEHSSLEQSVKNFQGIFLLAAGAREETIQNPAFLWPQSSKTAHKILFGSFIEYQTQGQKGASQGQLDTTLFEQNGLDFVVKAPKNSIYPTGSSYAVARAAGFLLSRCLKRQKALLAECIGGFSHKTLLKSPQWRTGKIYKAITFHK